MNDDREPSLDAYLEGQGNDGSLDSEGQFTLAKEKAVLKLAESQFAGEADWAAKIIQAIVREGNSESIRVKLGSKTTSFHFQTADWTHADIEAAFYDPDVPRNSSLGHLVRGLWSVAIRDKKPFGIKLQNSDIEVHWDTLQLTQRKAAKISKETSISVALYSEGQDSGGWLGLTSESASLNLQLSGVFRRKCYTCPLPLTVDGQRTDSLQHSPDYGWSKQTFPFGIGFVDGNIPEFRIPPGTFKKTKAPAHDEKDAALPTFSEGPGGDKSKLAKAVMNCLKARATAAAAFMLSFSWERCVTEDGHVVHYPLKTASRIFWVIDGVIVGRELWTEKKTECAVACYLSAEGLETDLSTLSVVDSEEKRSRSKLAQRLIVDREISDLRNLLHADMAEKKIKLKSQLGGVALLIASLGVGYANPIAGSITGIMGLKGILDAGKTDELDFLIKDVKKSLESLESRIS